MGPKNDSATRRSSHGDGLLDISPPQSNSSTLEVRAARISQAASFRWLFTERGENDEMKLDDEQKCCMTIIAPPGDALSILAVRLCQTLRKGRPRESMVQYQGIILR